MKAMVLYAPDKIENKPLIFGDFEKPEPKPNELRIKVKTCGVCHTDLHEVEGELSIPNIPIIPGHEVIGIVDKCGDKILNYKIGDRVGVAWIHNSCGICKFCIRGNENLCDNAKFTGYNMNGGYAEYMVVPNSYAYLIPKIFTDRNAAPLMCAGVIGYRSIRLSGLKKGDRLGLYGFGASAHIVIQIAKFWNCETYVFTRSKNHQQHALELGAAWVGTSKQDPPKKIDRAIMFAPAGNLVIDVLDHLDKGGTIAINAIHLSDIPPISWDKLWHEKKIVSVANTTRQDAIEFLKIAAEIPIKTDTVKYKLEDANQALMDIKYSKINGAAVLELD
jgi:propanol-preferring alcohol dehydrogenase